MGGPAPVILIEDNAEFAALLGTLISEQGLHPIIASCAEDGAILLTAYPHAVAIVLDLLLPDMTGQKLLFRWVQEGKKLPPVLVMTGVFTGPAQQEKVRAICDVAGWYEKPFDTRVLVEALAKIAGIAPISRRDHAELDDFDIVEGTPVSSIDAVDADDAHRLIGTGDLEDPTVADEDDFDAESDLATVIEGPPKFRYGDLSRTTIPSLLAAVYAAQETAEIVFERDQQKRTVYFSRGCPVYATSSDGTGDTRSILSNLFAWSSGRYVVGFRTQDPGAKGERLDPARLILEGVREQFDLSRLRALVPPTLRPMPSPSAPFPLYALPLDDREAPVLLRATGARSVEAIVREVSDRTPEREVLAALYSLLTLGVLVDVRALP